MARRKPAAVFPRCLIKAYRRNRAVNGNSMPDLMICEDPKDSSWYIFSGADVDRGLYDAIKNKQEDRLSWLYERLELYADGQQLTFVMPTISTETGGEDDSIGTFTGNNPVPGSGPENFLNIRCHMLLLNGEEQNDKGIDRTSIGLKLTMYRHDDGRTWLSHAELGAKVWSIPLALLNFGTQVQQTQYTEDLKGSPGPLLQTASISSFGGFNDTLKIALQVVNTVPTFALVFTPDVARGALNLTASPPQLRLPVPVHATRGTYQIIQRATDLWLAGLADEEWLVQFDCDGFENLWNDALTQYRNALKTVRPVNRLTLIPSITIQPTGPGTFNLRIRLTITRAVKQATPYAAHFQDLQVVHAVVIPPQKLDSVLTLHLGGGSRRDYSADITAVTTDQPERSFAFSATIKADSTPQAPRQVRIGSLDLEFGAPTKELTPQTLQLLDLSQGSLTVPRFHTKMVLPIASLTPGGQDGLPSSEYAPENYDEADGLTEQCIELRFTGSAPVVISPAGNSQQGPYQLSVDESNPNLYSDTIFLRLDSTLQGGSGTASEAKPLRVIVIDSDPLLVAAVDYSLLKPGANSKTVALWDTGELQGAAWQLQTNAQPFALTLPPQVLGEEMPKAHEFDSYDPNPPLTTDDLKALDFRFSPPAIQQVQGSYTPQNFADAPWNLRRILGYPGQRDPGVGVVQLSYELLYGLSCTAAAPLMRLAEIFSLLGRIPGRIPKNASLLDQPLETGNADTSPKAIYQSERILWSFYAALYNTRVAILEPRMPGANFGLTVGATGASGPPEVLTLNSGVQCTLRSDADLFYSLDPIDLANVDNDTFPLKSPNPLRPPGPGLRGGVTWPFESPRLFHATVRNPKSSSAIVSGLELSPLGGSGKQKIGFDRDLSTVSSVTEIGRNSKISVARLGRIGCFHNLARYVIEYERDVVSSQQFATQQTAFKGRPVLRKVREFVEVLEPIANLSNSSQVVPGAGCVNSIEFKQTIIPVTSKWSANVGDTGWKIPLWFEPDAPPAVIKPGDTTYYYPLPTIVFNLAGADGGADVECTIQTVGKLFFYTDTDPNADPDPHNWPIVPGVDFSPICACAANPPFPGNSVNELPAYDPPVPFGLSAFTYTIAPGHGKVNLVSGRAAQAIGATLTSLTLQRGPQSALISWQQTIQDVHDLIRQKIFTSVRNNPQAVNGLATSLQTSVQSFQSALSAQVTTLTSAVELREAALLKQYAGQVTQEINLVQDELRAQFQSLVGAQIQAVKTAAHVEVDAFFQRLNGIPVAANAMAQFAYSCESSLAGAQQQLADLNQQLGTAIQNASNSVNATGAALRGNLVALKSALTQPLDGIDILLSNVRAQVQARAENWMPVAPLVCHIWENQICAATAKFQNVIAQANTVIADIDASADAQIAADTKALTDAIDSVNAASGVLGKIVLDSGPLAGFKTQAEAIGTYLAGVKTTLETVQAGTKDMIDTAIDGAVTNTTQLVAGDIDLITNALVNLLLKQVDVVANLNSQVLGYADLVVQKLTAALAHISEEVNNAIALLQGAANNVQEAARKAVEQALGRYVESVAQALPPISANLPSGAQVATILQRAFGTAPAIPNLGFSLPNVAYFFQQADPHISLTPLLTQVKDLGAGLSPLSTMVPSFQLLDRAIPVPTLPNFDLSSVFPDFAGLKLSNLFPSLKLPTGAGDAVKITHGLDAQSRQAWVQADIDLQTAPATIFSIGPMALQIQNARFQSQVRAQADSTGQVARRATGSITGDWQLLIGGSPMITLVGTALSFDENGKIHVNVSPDRVQLSAALSFVQQIIAQYTSPDGGFGIYPSATGIETRLSLPIPDTSLGTTGITNLTFNFLFGLSWANDFELYAGFGLASPNKPFNLSVFILGGGGHLVATARYRPGGKLTCQVDMALDASASLGIAFGPISGNVSIALGMRFIFNSGQGDLSLGIFLLIVGEASILSIVSANITLRLEATYENGSFTGRGLFSISIKICWCFTLNVSQQVACHLGSSGGQAFNEPFPMPWLADTATDAQTRVLGLSTVPPQSVIDNYNVLATRYINLIS